MRVIAAVTCMMVLALAGCASGSSAKWYAPATWLSSRPAGNVDRAQASETIAEKAAVKAAQKATHQTSVALASAPSSRPVIVATEANATALALLDQAAGPLDAAELASIREMVAGLLSENAEIRAKAEKERAAQAKDVAEISVRLTKAQAATEAAEGKLRQAFDRENALANELRSQRALLWIAAGVAVLCAAGWVYLRFFLGGLPMAAGKLMRDLRQTKPDVAAVVGPMFDTYLNRHEQAAIARHAS